MEAIDQPFSPLTTPIQRANNSLPHLTSSTVPSLLRLLASCCSRPQDAALHHRGLRVGGSCGTGASMGWCHLGSPVAAQIWKYTGRTPVRQFSRSVWYCKYTIAGTVHNSRLGVPGLSNAARVVSAIFCRPLFAQIAPLPTASPSSGNFDLLLLC